ncbi:hypothetical protein KUV56_13730 [Ferrimonas balearica]|uniref:hypothetical protein n=1 Tax=Ferrimonas balearica TaxID=44012 RepID=UPI001C57AB59|nr:hypothetical protein [Ferrimonas balearica]MBW3140556.1 hypothetical protein [Ferrimonas balearica]
MTSVNTYLKEHLHHVSKNVFTAPDIPEKKLNNAAKSFELGNRVNAVVAIYDNTVFGSAKEGLVFTGEKIYIKEVFESAWSINFSEIESAEYVNDISVNEKGKEKRTEYIRIILRHGATKVIKSLNECDYSKLTDILTEVTTGFSDYQEENQLLTLAEMPEALKVAYVKVIINMAFSDDGEVDKKEFAEILLLMNRIDLSTESRFELRAYINSPEQQRPLIELLDIIDNSCIPSHNKAIKVSLTKDLISTYMSVNDGVYQNFAFLDQHKALIGVSDEEIELALMAIQHDHNMLKEEFTDDALKRGMKELTAKAGAVGLPIAAVYLSGSVVGLSAAGMTSGLAALGLGGVLGFSSMATGVGVAILLGVGAYKGIRHLTGANELDKSKRRELMLNEVIKQTQSTLSTLIEDLNFITEKFNAALNEQALQGDKIKQLQQMMTALTGAAGVLNQKSCDMQSNAIKLKCPKHLDDAKLKSLTGEPIKQQFYPVVASFYEEQTITEMRNDKPIQVTRLTLKNGISTRQLERLADIFDGLGYFRATDVIKGKLSGMFS